MAEPVAEELPSAASEEKNPSPVKSARRHE
jgi:hypothetical protein